MESENVCLGMNAKTSDISVYVYDLDLPTDMSNEGARELSTLSKLYKMDCNRVFLEGIPQKKMEWFNEYSSK